MTNETYFTLEELMTMDYMGLASTQSAIDAVVESAKRENDFYIGTDMKRWLKSLNIMNWNEMTERFCIVDEDGEETENIDYNYIFKEIFHDNSYNWCGNSSTDIDFKLLQDEYENMFAYIRVHIGNDIRAGYTDGLLIDLETTNQDCLYRLFEDISAHDNMEVIEVEGKKYSISGNITSEYIDVYGHDNDLSDEIATSCYCHSKEQFEKELQEIVLEAIKNNN